MTEFSEKDLERSLAEICMTELELTEEQLAKMPEPAPSRRFQKKMKGLFLRRKLRYDRLLNTAGRRAAAVILCFCLAGASMTVGADALQESLLALFARLDHQYTELPSFSDRNASHMLYYYEGAIVWEQKQEDSAAFVDYTGEVRKEIPAGISGLAALDFDGNVLTADMDPETSEVTVVRYQRTGEPERTVKLEGLHKSPYLKIQKIMADEEYLYLIVRVTGGSPAYLQVYDWDGDLCMEYAETGDAAIDGKGNVYAVTSALQDQTRLSLLKINAKTREQSWMVPFNETFCQIDYSREDGLLYLSSNKEVSVLRPENGQKEKTILTVGQDTSFYPEDMSFYYDFAVGEDRTLVYSFTRNYENGEEYAYQEFSSFVHDQDAPPPEIQVDFSVTAPYASDYLDDAVMRFERENPGWTILVDPVYASWDEYAGSASEYREELLRRLSAGTAGDLILFDGRTLPARDMLEHPDLMDLTEYLEKSGLSDKLNPVVLEEMAKDSQLKCLLVNYEVSCLIADGSMAEKLGVDLDSLDSWADIFALLPEIKEKSPETPLFSGEKEEITRAMLQSGLTLLADEERQTISLDQEWFRRDLAAWRGTYNDPQFGKEREISSFDPLSGGMFALYDLGEGFLSDDFSVASAFPDYRLLPMPGAGPITPGQTFAIPKDAQNPDAAWEFLEYLCSEEGQTLFTFRHIPMNLAAEEAFWKEYASNADPVEKQRLRDMKSVSRSGEALPLPSEMEDLFGLRLRMYLYGSWALEETLQSAEKALAAALKPGEE